MNPESFFTAGGEVREMKDRYALPAIHPNLLAEAERINAGKTIDVAELDKPIAVDTAKKEIRALSFAKPEPVSKELRDEVLAQVEAMRTSPLRPFETQEGRDAIAARLKAKVELAYQDRLFNSMVFVQDELIHIDCFGV